MSPLTLSVCLKYRALAFFLLFFQVGFGQYNFTELDKEFQAKQKLLGNDIVFIIWKGDSTVYKKEIGDFNAKTVAPIASCSKWLTAALVMQFIDEGKLSLDDKVSRWIPAIESYGKGYITIRHCLSHMTGISDNDNFLKRMVQRSKFTSLEEEVNKFASREIRANAGTDFWYGNIGLNIAARVLEVISKKRFDLLIKQKLFTPMGMRKTSFSTTDNTAPNPSGGAVSTADDYMRFLVMLLNKGKYEGKQILSEKAVAQLREIQTTSYDIKYAPKAAQGFNYALGSWVVEENTQSPKNAAGKMEAAALASPGLFGTWPMVDFCRGYAYIVFVKNLLGEERADAHMALKKIIDKQVTSSCAK
jgi:CubicO group peptidase (beta-lactamase class C family)